MDGALPQTPQTGGQQPPPKSPPLTDKQKQDWNDFVDFTEKEGFKGNPILDDKDKHMGIYLMQKYNTLNPKSTITYNDVPRVQQEMQDYRNHALQQIHSGKSSADIKSDDEFMPNLSGVDGWLGSKTSSHKFPTATLTATNNGKTTVTNFGTNTQKYDEVMAKGIKGKL